MPLSPGRAVRLTLALAACLSAAADWPQWRGPDRATPKGYGEKGRFKQTDRSSMKAWPHPVVCDGKLYLRDWDTLLCYDLKGR
jgi:hypothetical protein